MMKPNLSILSTAVLLGGSLILSAPVAAKPNVLFISVDDLRPTLGVYGDTLAQTPNIDRLGQSGTTFMRAYCQQAVCSPSRTSIMTGLRPDTTRVYDLTTHFRTTIPDVVTMPQYFKNNGYTALSIGKIYHRRLNDKPSWNASWEPPAPGYGPQGLAIQKARKENAAAIAAAGGPKNPLGPAFEAPEVDDSALLDGATTDFTVQKLRELAQKPEQPFFLAFGLSKPHLPFVAPKKYWDKYKRSDFRLPANYRATPRDMPPIAAHTSGELRAYADIPRQGPLADAQALELIHGYYAATSYADAQVGRVLDELDRLKLRDNTVIVLWSDHGYHLGEHTMWNKHSNFEIATRTPLLLSVPGGKKNQQANQLSELVDVFPTLCEAVGLPIPAGLPGTSLLPIALDARAPGKAAAFSQYPRGDKDEFMGYSMRTDRYRYTEWVSRANGQSQGVELYDQQLDPQENQNVATKPENRGLIAALSRHMHAVTPPVTGWVPASTTQPKGAGE